MAVQYRRALESSFYEKKKKKLDTAALNVDRKITRTSTAHTDNSIQRELKNKNDPHTESDHVRPHPETVDQPAGRSG